MERLLEKLPGPASLPELVDMEREKVEDQRHKGLPGKDLWGLKHDQWPHPEVTSSLRPFASLE